MCSSPSPLWGGEGRGEVTPFHSTLTFSLKPFFRRLLVGLLHSKPKSDQNPAMKNSNIASRRVDAARAVRRQANGAIFGAFIKHPVRRLKSFFARCRYRTLRVATRSFAHPNRKCVPALQPISVLKAD